jgi:hypothetical protein
MGICLSRYLCVSGHCEEIFATLRQRGWEDIANENFHVLRHDLSLTAVQISFDDVLVVVKTNAVVIPRNTYTKLNEYFKKSKYTPHAIYATDIPDHIFVRTWLLGPQTIAIDLQSGKERILFTDAKVFVGNYAVSILPEGVMFQPVQEIVALTLVPWVAPFPSPHISYWDDASGQGAVLWLTDKGYFTPVFRVKGTSDVISLRDMQRKTEMGQYEAVLKPHKEARKHLHALTQALVNTSPQEDPVVRLSNGKLDTMWWTKESGDRVIVNVTDNIVFVVGATKTKRSVRMLAR